jgi:hypothetical protein
MEVSGQLHALPYCTLGIALCTYWIGDWVGLKVDLDVIKKRKISCPCEPRLLSNPARRLVAIPTELSGPLSVIISTVKVNMSVRNF